MLDQRVRRESDFTLGPDYTQDSLVSAGGNGSVRHHGVVIGIVNWSEYERSTVLKKRDPGNIACVRHLPSGSVKSINFGPCGDVNNKVGYWLMRRHRQWLEQQEKTDDGRSRSDH